MRTLILADVHANAAALEALPAADLVICAGDLVTYGPAPGSVVDALIRHGVHCVRGDEDDAVGHGTPHVLPPGLETAAAETRAWTRSALSEKQLKWLAALPPELEITAARSRLAVTHAYPGVYDRYLSPTDEELSRTARAFPRAEIVILGHTHRRGMWKAEQTTILMPGSVGQPERPGYVSYALLEHGAVTFHEVPYDVDRTVREIEALPWSAPAKDECIRALRVGAVRPRQRIASPLKGHPVETTAT